MDGPNNRFSSETSSASSSPAHNQTDIPPSFDPQFPVTAQMFYLPPWPWTLLLLHVCLQPNQKIQMFPFLPTTTSVSQEDGVGVKRATIYGGYSPRSGCPGFESQTR
ncbi:hypothetical protein ILYODFUR_014406 [Ilyodon furcidens]|uniref:Uncharacterized protein n=1 Tax=Ilyodon furcidens TaxID=33524 RepID=A0ABV0SZK3_9TELE